MMPGGAVIALCNCARLPDLPIDSKMITFTTMTVGSWKATLTNNELLEKALEALEDQQLYACDFCNKISADEAENKSRMELEAKH